ncbi:adhesion G-protein coupled receptor G4 isoform X2 [Pseudoliparis swirei]|uniref:adhesion G-protein coupled receptor G4 isoform X2 n=1 Tax=Pseudoliparis swirei TaxID=2059687 RepID=UPI0024BE92C0|nr:adhesion G-protein coupled receptor G4 isoform X2 [Pseudoliparis swirei]
MATARELRRGAGGGGEGRQGAVRGGAADRNRRVGPLSRPHVAGGRHCTGGGSPGGAPRRAGGQRQLTGSGQAYAATDATHTGPSKHRHPFQPTGGVAASSASTSLWGKKLLFWGRPCIWQLQPEVVVPALQELSACMLLRHTHALDWTGFDYKAPGKAHIELGLGGTGTHLSVWLFGEMHSVKRDLKLLEWYTVCVTWSGRAHMLRIYINGTSKYETSVKPILPQQLASHGTLTLGVSHYTINNGEVQPQTGKDLLGEIGLFRMWAREWSAEELKRQSCAEGDVLRWDLRQWKHNCRLEPDNNLHCAWSLYKINMWTFVTHSKQSGNCSLSWEDLTRNWLQSIFPHNISVHNVLLSSSSRSCHVVNKSAALPPQLSQGSRALSNSTCNECFSCEVYVNVDPAADVEVVQAHIASLLSSTFSSHFLTMRADPHSISVVPVELLPALTATTVSSGVSTPAPTQSLPARPANMSTTGDPLDLNETVVGPDTFFRVDLSLGMYGSQTKSEEIIEKWVKEQLDNGTMIVLNLIIEKIVGRNMGQHNGLMMFHGQQKQYYCAFHVQEFNKNTVADIFTHINAALKPGFRNGTIIIETLNMSIKHIVPANCLEETTSTIYGVYIWPEAFPTANQDIGCKKPKLERAFRLCKLDIETDTSSWVKPDMKNCKPLVTISDLDNITVSTGNGAEVVDMIQDLVDVQLGNSAELSPSELNTVVEKLCEVIDISIIKPAVGANIVNIIADILLSKTYITPVASIILNLTERMANNMDFQEGSICITAPSMAVSMINVDQNEFSGLTFGVSFTSSNVNPEVFVNNSFVSELLPGTDTTISLPSELHNLFPPGERTTRVQFQFFGTDELFQDPRTTNATPIGWKMHSFVVSASINNSHISNLKDGVVVTFSHQTPKQPKDKVLCMFWDFQENGGRGGWNSRGCETQSVSAYRTSCLCDHLTHFAVLLDVSRTPISEADRQILTVISNLGCGISSIFLGITLLTYLSFEKLRRDYPSKILINLSAALLGLSMLFLLDSWLSSFSNYSLCIATAATMHYFLLASFTWMGLEAVHMYLALVKVFNIYVPSYILKFCAVGWGVPLVIVSLVLAIDKDAYGSSLPDESAVMLQSSDQFCWLQNDVFFYVTVVAFVLLILLCNTVVFIVVLIQIRKMRANKHSTNRLNSLHDLRAVAGLTVLLGLTWSIGFFSFGAGKVVFMYLFSIFNTLQGFFVFLFHCLMKENVRTQWRIHLCCGRLRLNNGSDWSRSMTAGGRCNNNRLVNSDSVASENTSTIRKV